MEKSHSGPSLSMKLRTTSLQGERKEKDDKLPKLCRSPIRVDLTRVNDVHERLSGSYQFDNSMGVLADRHIVAHPVTVCVRCGNHASVCMECTEQLCNKSVMFFRESRSKGAANLFHNTIKDAGIAKATRNLIFLMWKNGFLTRKRLANRMKNVVDKMFGSSILYAPFKAWQKFTKENLIKRKDKRMQELGAKVTHLEALLRAGQKERAVVDANVVTLNGEILKHEQRARDYEDVIKRLKFHMAEERNRVVGLSILAEHFVKGFSHFSELTQKELKSLSNELITTFDVIPGHDYSQFVSNIELTTMEKLQTQKIERGFVTGGNFSADVEDELNFVSTLLIQWINYNSYRCGFILDSHNLSAENYVPPYEKTTSLTDLMNGKQLSRLIVCLIYDMKEKVTPASLSDSVLSTGFSMLADLETLQKYATMPFLLTGSCIKIASKHLSIPPYDVNMVRGDRDTLQAYLTHLMLIASPVLSPKLLSELKKFSFAYDRVAEIIQSVSNDSKLLEKVESVATACNNIVGTSLPMSFHHNEDESELLEKVVGAEGQGFAELVQNIKDKITNIEEPKVDKTKAFRDLELRVDDLRSKDLHELDIEKLYPGTFGDRFDTLTSAVNRLLQDEKFPDNISDLITRECITYSLVSELREQFNGICKRKDDGMRSGDKVRDFCVGSTNEILLTKVRWSTDMVKISK